MKKFFGIVITLFLRGNARGFEIQFLGLMNFLAETYSPIHFGFAGNNNVGAIIWMPSISHYDGVSLSLNDGSASTRKCYKQMRGFYFSSVKGVQIYPLDRLSQSILQTLHLSYQSMTMSGGFYTSCEPSGTRNNTFAIYGDIVYKNNMETHHLIAGSLYDIKKNIYEFEGTFRNSFEFFNGQTPLGYLFDTEAGIGFVGGLLSEQTHREIQLRLSKGDSINDIFGYGDSDNVVVGTGVLSGYYAPGGENLLFSLGVIGNIILSPGSVSDVQGLTIQGNSFRYGTGLRNQDNLVINSSVTNISPLLDNMRKNTEKICRDKRQYLDNQTDISFSDNVVCLQRGLLSRFVIQNTEDVKNKTLVLKNIDLKLEFPLSDKNIPLDVFIDQGNLLLDELSPSTKVYFDDECNVTSSTVSTRQGQILKGNFFVNGLIRGPVDNTFPRRLCVQGKIATLNTASRPTEGRIEQVVDTLNTGVRNDVIYLGNVFTWNCNAFGTGSDGTLCDMPIDKFRYSSMIIHYLPIQSALFDQ